MLEYFVLFLEDDIIPDDVLLTVFQWEDARGGLCCSQRVV